VITTVWVRTGRNQAQCGCGWRGRRRLFRGSAVVDALMHCADTGHEPAGAPAMYNEQSSRH
jgi:hypothetical protein